MTSIRSKTAEEEEQETADMCTDTKDFSKIKKEEEDEEENAEFLFIKKINAFEENHCDDGELARQSAAGGKRRKHDEHKLSSYNKNQILDYLKTNGCTVKNFEKVLKTFKINRECAIEYFNKQIEEAEAHVYQECESLSFENISEWLQLFKSWKVPQHNYLEHAIVLNAIENSEEHPDPKDLCGIDLKSIYKFISNAMLGLPQSELSKETAEFLTEEFEMLINAANTDSADVETKKIKINLQNGGTKNLTIKNNYKLSLDPLMLDKDIS